MKSAHFKIICFYRSFIKHFSCLFIQKPTKKVMILSSKHRCIKTKKNRKRRPGTISYYNKTKFGVDVVDQMVGKYSVKSKWSRWPVHVFFNTLDFTGINAWIFYQATTGIKISRRQRFLLQLANELVTEYHEFLKEEKVIPTGRNIEQPKQ